jgi:predicted RNase H-like HicB family nuclease
LQRRIILAVSRTDEPPTWTISVARFESASTRRKLQTERKGVDVAFLTKASARTVVEVPVFCRIWQEQGVFNGVAEHLPVAVFGKTYEEAQSNPKDAILSHLAALREVHQLDEVVEHLRSQARETQFSPRELPRDGSFFRFSAAIHDSRILALV